MDESIDIRFLMNSPEVEREADRVKSSISGVEKSVNSTAKAMSEAFNSDILNSEDIDKKIRVQKSALKDLERAFESTRKKVDAMAPGLAKETAKKELAEARKEIDAEKIALEQLTKIQEDYKQSTVSMRTKIRNLKEDMAGMTEGTDEYIAKMRELGDLEDRFADVSKQGKIFSDDEKNIRAATEAIQGLSGAMSAAVGIASLLGTSEENLIKVQTRLQAVMAISVGVNQVAQVLNKDSYFSHLILVRAKNLLTAAETRLTAALWGSAAAAKAAMAALTLGASVAIIGIIALLSKLQKKREEQKKKEEEAAEAQKKYYNSVSDSVSKSLADYRKLQSMWKSLNGDSVKQQKFLEGHADKFKELGVQINTVRDAENLLINNETKFIQSLMNRARAAAAMELAADKYKIAVEKMAEIQDGVYSKDDMKKAKENVSDRYGSQQIELFTKTFGANWLDNEYKQEAARIAGARLRAEVEKAEKDAENRIKQAIKSEKTAEDLLKEAGIKTSNDDKGTKTDPMVKYEEAILISMRELEKSRIAVLKDGKQKELKELDLRHQETLAQIKKDRKELETAAKAVGLSGLSEQQEAGFIEREKNAHEVYVSDKQEIDRKYQESLEEVCRGLSDVFLTEEERKQAEIKRTYDEIRKQAQKRFESGDISEAQYIDLKIRIDSAEAHDQVKDLLGEFRNYEQQRLEIAREYDEKIATLEKQNIDGRYDEAIAQARKQRDRELAEFDNSTEHFNNLWSKLFDNWSHYTNEQLRSIIDNAREVLNYINSTPEADIEGKFGLSAEQLRNLKGNALELGAAYEALGERVQQLNKNNPFASLINNSRLLTDNTKKLAQARKNLDAAKQSGDKTAIKSAEQEIEVLSRQEAILKGDLKDSALAAVSYLSDIGSAFESIGEAAGDAGLASFGKLLSEVTDIASQALSGDILGAAVSAVTTGLTAIFSSKAKYKAALKQMHQDQIAFAHEYKMIMSDIRLQAEEASNAFTEDSFAKAIAALKELSTNYQEFIQRINKSDNVSGGTGFFADIKKARKEAQGITTDLQNIWIQTRHKTAFRSAKGSYLKDLYPELFGGEYGFDVNAARALLATNNQLNDEARRQIQELIDIYDQWKEAEEQFKEYLSNTFGEIGNSLGDSIVSAFEDGTNAMENWAKSFNNVLKNLAKQLMQSLFFQSHFDRLESDLTNIYDKYGDDENLLGRKVQDLFGSFFSGMEGQVKKAESWYQDFAQYASKYGFDLSGEDNSVQSGVSGQLQAQMTEGTASQLVGLWNITAMEIRQVRELTTGQLEITADIRDNVGQLLTQVILIERNTRETSENTAQTVKQLEDGFAKMEKQLAEIEKNTKPNNSRL